MYWDYLQIKPTYQIYYANYVRYEKWTLYNIDGKVSDRDSHTRFSLRQASHQMFDSPRRLAASTPNGFSASYSNEGPLSYDDSDPWGASSMPIANARPPEDSSSFSAVIGEATIPNIYQRSFLVVEHNGEASVNGLMRVMMTSNLPSTTIQRVRHPLYAHKLRITVSLSLNRL